MERDHEVERERFASGETDRIRLGGYGGTVTVTAVDGRIRIETTRPRRRRKTLSPDVRATRQAAMDIATDVLEKARGSYRRSPAAGEKQRDRPAPAPGLLTPREVWMNMLRRRLGEIPDGVLDWTRRDVARRYEAMTPPARTRARSVDYICSIVQAARRLDRDGVVRLDADLDTIETGDLDQWVTEQLCLGRSPHSAKTYMGRFRTAIRRLIKDRKRQWGDRTDPTLDMDLIDTSSVEPAEVGEERAATLLSTLREMGEWRAFAAAAFALEYGRRIGAIGGTRPGMHLDAPPLCARDFAYAEDGALEITFRANAQKGDAYGRGDARVVATELTRSVYEWLRADHPNPLGEDHPLIWDEDDPARAESYDSLRRVLGEAWRRAFGERRPKGLSWHAFIRTAVTTIANDLGSEAAAEFTGRSVETVMRRYWRPRRGRQRQIAGHLDAVRGRNMARVARGNGAGGGGSAAVGHPKESTRDEAAG